MAEFGKTYSKFPGLTTDQVGRLEQVTAHLQGIEKKQAQQELYRQTITQIQAQQRNDERFAAENEQRQRSLTKSEKEKNTDQSGTRLEDLSDKVKEYYGLDANANTDVIMDGLVNLCKDKGINPDLINNYLKKGDSEILYQLGFEERPEEKTNWLKGASYYLNPLGTLALDLGEWMGGNPDKAAEIGVGIAQSPGKRGYNILGQRIDKAAEAIGAGSANMLTDEQKEKVIDRLDKNTIFKRDAIEEYSKELEKQESEGTLYNGREKTDIRTPILGEERANSEYTQLGETIGDIGTAVAMSYGMGAGLSPVMTESTLLGRSLLGGGQGILDMATYAYGSEGRAATPGELAFGGGAGSVLPLVGPTYKALSSKYDAIKQTFKESTKKKLGEELRTLFEKGVRPSSAGIKSTTAQEKIYDDAIDAVESIINNKSNLKFTNANGEEIIGELPKTNREFAQAISQTKKAIYDQYNSIAQKAGQEVRVSLDDLTEELLKLKKDKAALLGNDLETRVDNWLKGLSEVKDLSVEQAQRKMQEINKKLDAFYRNPNPNDVSASAVDSLVNNKIAEAVDNAIDSALGSSEQYRALKKAYSSLKTIEKDVNHRAIVSGRQSPNSLVDSIADISSMDSLLDILSGNPVGAVKALGKQVLKKYIKDLNSTDNMVKKLFEKAEKGLMNEKSLAIPKNYEYNIGSKNLSSNQLTNGGEQAINRELGEGVNGIKGNGTNGGTNQGVLGESSMTDIGAGQGGAGASKGIVEITDGNEMRAISEDLQKRSTKGLYMDVHDPEHYANSKNFVSPNRDAAISVTKEEVGSNIGNFIRADDGQKGVGKDLMLKAMEAGGNKMDNYGVGLTNYYENFGFKPVARVKFNREFAPEGWDFAKNGEPDIYFMMHNGDDLATVKSKFGTYKHMTPQQLDNLPEMDYKKAMKYRDDMLKTQMKQKEILGNAKANQDTIFNEYSDKFGSYVNPDEFRARINENGKYEANLTHEGASYLSDTYFNNLLNKAGKGSKGVVVAGGPGSGKGFSADKLGIKPENYEIFVDKTKGNKELYKMLDKGMDVDYYVVIPDIDKVIGQITGRAISKGRTLPINSRGLPTHKEVVQVVKEVLEKQKNGGNFRFHFITNPGKGGVTKELGMEDGMKLFEEYSKKIGERTPERVEKEVRNFVNEKGEKPTETQIRQLIASIGGILGIGSMLGYELGE